MFVSFRAGRPAGFIHLHVADDPIGKPSGQPHPFPAKWQVSRLVRGAGHVARHSHNLETAVQNQRVYFQAVTARRFGQGDLSQGLAGAGPYPAQGAKGRPQVNAGGSLGAVIGGHVRRCKPGLQAIQVHALFRFRQRGVRDHPAFNVHCPAAFLTTAENLNQSLRTFVGIFQERLKLSTPGRHGFSRFLLREDQRTMQLDVVQYHRAVAFEQRCGGRHGPIESSGGDQSAKDPVVLQPVRVGRKNLILEDKLSPCRLTAIS